MAYGEPLTIALALLGTALVGGTVATEVDANKAKKEREKAEKEQRKAERDQKYQESLASARTAEAQALDTEIALRERLHREKVAQSDAKTEYVDAYRGRLGFTGDAYDQILADLYSQERKVALERQNATIQNEQKEIDDLKGSNLGQIALYSFFGIASVGAFVYLKRRKQS